MEILDKLSNKALIVFFFGAFFTISFLFFIDEGYYNFNWMSVGFSWFIFALYAIPVFFLQVIGFYLLQGLLFGDAVQLGVALQRGQNVIVELRHQAAPRLRQRIDEAHWRRGPQHAAHCRGYFCLR